MKSKRFLSLRSKTKQNLPLKEFQAIEKIKLKSKKQHRLNYGGIRTWERPGTLALAMKQFKEVTLKMVPTARTVFKQNTFERKTE